MAPETLRRWLPTAHCPLPTVLLPWSVVSFQYLAVRQRGPKGRPKKLQKNMARNGNRQKARGLHERAAQEQQLSQNLCTLLSSTNFLPFPRKPQGSERVLVRRILPALHWKWVARFKQPNNSTGFRAIPVRFILQCAVPAYKPDRAGPDEAHSKSTLSNPISKLTERNRQSNPQPKCLVEYPGLAPYAPTSHMWSIVQGTLETSWAHRG